MTVALWYSNLRYDLFDSEDAAAMAAVVMDEAGYPTPDGVQFAPTVDGVQFADGRLIEAEDWEAYRLAERHRVQDYVRPKRKIQAPFGGGETYVDADAPSWLGKPSPTEES